MKKQGFTLIEMVMYIGLFTLLLTGLFTSAYQILSSNNVSTKKNIVQDEANFVTRKITWALTSIDPNMLPIVSGTRCQQSISINKLNYENNPIVLRIHTASSTLEMKEGSASTYTPITTTNISVSCFAINTKAANGGSPYGLTATTTIHGSDFSVTKYIRK